MKASDILLYAAAILVLNYLFLGYLGMFFLLADLALVIVFLYRVYQFVMLQYPIRLETMEKDVVVTYDRGLKRRLPYKEISHVSAEEYGNRGYVRLNFYAKSIKAIDTAGIARGLIAEPDIAKKLIQDISERAGLKHAG